jgi:16S rRNA (adenine1518-N6/adenine1519-N6)-dimethyltransferase
MEFVNKPLYKKKFGQHFLRSTRVVTTIIESVSIDHSTSIFEIGCGDGFLTRAILTTPCARLWVFEIDPEWAEYVRSRINDPRLTLLEQNILELDVAQLKEYAPWTLLANLPYQITFPILHMLWENRAILNEGVIMVQEEVAQKIVKNHGKGYGFSSLFFQYYFEWKMLDKIAPSDFEPAPKVYSRLLYFKPKVGVPTIPHEAQFWNFIKVCFKYPRRTFANNIKQTHIPVSLIPDAYLSLRAQQMTIDDFLLLWNLIRTHA